MKTNKVDKSDMREIILNFPNQLKDGVSAGAAVKMAGPFENIIICGVGGSALPGNILNCWTQMQSSAALKIPIYIHRDYGLPPNANKNSSLIICISYSGNTEESISALEASNRENFKTCAIASGGKVEEICHKFSIPLAKINGGLQPRMANGLIFGALISILNNAGLIINASAEISDAVERLNILNTEKEAEKIAKKIIGKIPLIYSSNAFKCLARIWKIKFNENAKVPAFYNYFPELNHNEMAGYAKTGNRKPKIKNFYVIILRDSSDHPKILKRMELTGNLIKEAGAKVEFVDIKAGSPLFKIFSTLVLGDWISYYLALAYKVDPTPVEIVEKFKKELER